MKSFNIVNMASGEELGRYWSRTVAEALDALARTAGFRDFAEAVTLRPALGRELFVTEL